MKQTSLWEILSTNRIDDDYLIFYLPWIREWNVMKGEVFVVLLVVAKTHLLNSFLKLRNYATDWLGQVSTIRIFPFKRWRIWTDSHNIPEKVKCWGNLDWRKNFCFNKRPLCLGWKAHHWKRKIHLQSCVGWGDMLVPTKVTCISIHFLVTFVEAFGLRVIKSEVWPTDWNNNLWRLFGCFSGRKDSKLGNEFVQRREIFLIWENWLWFFVTFCVHGNQKTKRYSSENLVRISSKCRDCWEWANPKTRSGLNLKLHCFVGLFIICFQRCRKKSSHLEECKFLRQTTNFSWLETPDFWNHPPEMSRPSRYFQKKTAAPPPQEKTTKKRRKKSTTTTTITTTSTTPCFCFWPHGTLASPPRSYDRIPDWAIPIAWHHVLHGLLRCQFWGDQTIQRTLLGLVTYLGCPGGK